MFELNQLFPLLTVDIVSFTACSLFIQNALGE